LKDKRIRSEVQNTFLYYVADSKNSGDAHHRGATHEEKGTTLSVSEKKDK